MQRILEDGQHEYKATPGEYPISDNDRPATYDQFITLRDTFIMSNKYYADKAGRSLIVGTKLDGTPTDTIEIREPNIVRLDFESSGTVTPFIQGQYVETGGHSGVSCEIMKKGRYRIQHKEQFKELDQSSITRVHSYVLQHKTDGTTQERAVFDWEWSTAGEFKRMTSFGYVECDLDVGDWLELKVEDQNGNDISSYIGHNANWLMVEYIDLAYNI